MDRELEQKIQEARAWLAQFLGQIRGDRAHTMNEADPMAALGRLNALRDDLIAAGYEVPKFTDMQLDPVANMDEWSAYLERVARVN